jgi:hypothetical protein
VSICRLLVKKFCDITCHPLNIYNLFNFWFFPGFLNFFVYFILFYLFFLNFVVYLRIFSPLMDLTLWFDVRRGGRSARYPHTSWAPSRTATSRTARSRTQTILTQLDELSPWRRSAIRLNFFINWKKTFFPPPLPPQINK